APVPRRDSPRPRAPPAHATRRCRGGNRGGSSCGGSTSAPPKIPPGGTEDLGGHGKTGCGAARCRKPSVPTVKDRAGKDRAAKGSRSRRSGSRPISRSKQVLEADREARTPPHLADREQDARHER